MTPWPPPPPSCGPSRWCWPRSTEPCDRSVSPSPATRGSWSCSTAVRAVLLGRWGAADYSPHQRDQHHRPPRAAGPGSPAAPSDRRPDHAGRADGRRPAPGRRATAAVNAVAFGLGALRPPATSISWCGSSGSCACRRGLRRLIVTARAPGDGSRRDPPGRDPPDRRLRNPTGSGRPRRGRRGSDSTTWTRRETLKEASRSPVNSASSSTDGALPSGTIQAVTTSPHSGRDRAGHRHLEHPGMVGQHVLHLAWVDVEPAGDDQLPDRPWITR